MIVLDDFCCCCKIQKSKHKKALLEFKENYIEEKTALNVDKQTYFEKKINLQPEKTLLVHPKCEIFFGSILLSNWISIKMIVKSKVKVVAIAS